MHIREAVEEDLESMWGIFRAVRGGDALPFSAAIDRDAFHCQWFSEALLTYVAEEGPHQLGMYKLGANYPGLAHHVASATYLVRPEVRDRGVGRALVQHSIARAQDADYLEMQFNYVPSSNVPAVTLYQELDFTIIDTLPNAFRDPQRGLVDVYVMQRFLQ
ncbi:GNAT family N-acetyltransferase [Microbulbifer marinus]|uniref:Acetyltransferase (GNAT) domain-containing protein n=1 Tax=Microbulbifer marinus TaxID=658218 RepID=A0A1H3YTS9_9GAMM|nr:GNAT family N-acetyltransferase [Microbulbifer marinus]SEA14810.1 Acetyltransferase (GNAT) domain-containing protein [Microbulbifer marinus]